MIVCRKLRNLTAISENAAKKQALPTPQVNPGLAGLPMCDELGGTAMYLKKVEGPRVVTLQDGTTLSRSDLPPKDTTRWVASRKAAVVRCLIHGLVTRDEVVERYALTEEELDSWLNAVKDHGENALRVTSLQRFRQL
jgi:hypothetical protein